MPKGVWSDHPWPFSPVFLDCSDPAAWVPLGALFAAQVPNNDIAIVIASRPRGNLTTSSALISQFQCWPSPICCLLLCIAKSDLATAHIYRDTAMSTNEKAPGRKGPKELSGSLFDCTRIAQPVIFLTAVGSVSTKHRSTKQRHETHTSRTQLGLYVYHRNASA